jgi:hypothetical protein
MAMGASKEINMKFDAKGMKERSRNDCVQNPMNVP